MTAVQGRDGIRLYDVIVEVASLLVFVVASAGLFLAFEWPPLLRQIVLTYLLAFVAFRVLTKLGRLLLVAGADVDPEGDRTPANSDESVFWSRRLHLFAGYFLFGWATVSVMPLLQFSVGVTRLVA